MASYISKINGFLLRDESAHTAIASINDCFSGSQAKQAICDGGGLNISTTYAKKTDLLDYKTAYAFENYSDLYTTLKLFTNISAAQAAFPVGTQFLIVSSGVPDYWVAGYTSTSDSNYGHFRLEPLETSKVDLSNYVSKTELNDYVLTTDLDSATVNKANYATKIQINTHSQTTYLVGTSLNTAQTSASIYTTGVSITNSTVYASAFAENSIPLSDKYERKLTWSVSNNELLIKYQHNSSNVF